MQYILEQGDQTLATHSGLALIGRLLERTSLNQRFNKVKLTQVEPEMSNGDVAFCYIGLLAQGKGDSDHIEPLFPIPTPTIIELYHGTSEQFHSELKKESNTII